MIKISDLKEGDIVMVDNEGTMIEGQVMEVNNARKHTTADTKHNKLQWDYYCFYHLISITMPFSISIG